MHHTTYVMYILYTTLTLPFVAFCLDVSALQSATRFSRFLERGGEHPSRSPPPQRNTLVTDGRAAGSPFARNACTDNAHSRHYRQEWRIPLTLIDHRAGERACGASGVHGVRIKYANVRSLTQHVRDILHMHISMACWCWCARFTKIYVRCCIAHDDTMAESPL